MNLTWFVSPMSPKPLLNTENQTQNYRNYSTPRKQRTNKPMSVCTLTRMSSEAVRDCEQGRRGKHT